jgi:hypothetical protein
VLHCRASLPAETAETEEEQEGEQDENRAGPSNRGAAAAVAGGRKRQRQQAAVKQEREQFVDLTQASRQPGLLPLLMLQHPTGLACAIWVY